MISWRNPSLLFSFFYACNSHHPLMRLQGTKNINVINPQQWQLKWLKVLCQAISHYIKNTLQIVRVHVCVKVYGECTCVHAERITLIAKFCVNIAFFRCGIHFSHIAASPYTKWSNTYTEVMAHWWLWHHSTLDLLANSVIIQPRPHTPLQHAQWQI